MNAQKSKLVPCLGIVTVQAIETAGREKYVECEITIDQGRFEGLTIITKIPDPMQPGGREGARQMGLQTLTRIFEAAKIFRHANPRSYRIFDEATFEEIAAELHGRRAAFMAEIGTGRFVGISEWLSPNPESSGFKGWQRLTAAA